MKSLTLLFLALGLLFTANVAAWREDPKGPAKKTGRIDLGENGVRSFIGRLGADK
jgi:hypothetical protein